MDIRVIMHFLEQLQRHNSKAWMDANRPSYIAAKEQFAQLVDHLLGQIQGFDPLLHQVTVPECIFRINKNDFSKKGEAPYKGHFGAGMSPGGRHSAYANYVFVLEPGNRSRVGGGIREPKPKQLALIREEIDYSNGELQQLLDAPDFAASFGGLRTKQLKLMPKGYPKTHPEAALLRYTGYQVLHYFTDEEVLSPDFTEQILPYYRQVKPFNDFLNRSITEV